MRNYINISEEERYIKDADAMLGRVTLFTGTEELITDLSKVRPGDVIKIEKRLSTKVIRLE